MKRKHFLQTILAPALIPTVSFCQTPKKAIRADKGFKIKAGEGRIHGHLKLKGVNVNILDVKISGKDTDGALAVFEQTSLSQGRGTPRHVHPLQDEVFYILEGEYLFQVGEDKYRLTTGESIFLPRKVPHAWTQVSEKGKMTVILQPAGKLEEFFVTMSQLEKEPTQAEIAQIFLDHEMQVVGPPLKLE